MVDYYRLKSVLERELDCQKKLLEVMERERLVLVSLDDSSADSLVEEKVKILEQARALQEKRAQITLNKADPEKRITLEEIIQGCSVPQIKKELSWLRKELKTVGEKVRALNDHNANLIRSSLGLVSSALAIIRSVPDAELPTYGYNAKLSSPAQDPAFAPRSRTIVREA